MKHLSLPMPGLRWGNYPERAEPPSTGGAAALPRRLRAALPQWSTARTDAFVQAVRAEQVRLGAMDSPLRSAARQELRLELRRCGLVDATLARAFACIAVACADVLGVALFDVQLVAARHVLDNRLAEMATGEGKTLTVALAAASAALAGIPLHVVTANDYLVERDAAQLRPVYAALGLTAGCVTQPLEAPARRTAYACDITYCTAKELVFDYLRDGLQRNSDPLQSCIDRIEGAGAAPLLRGLCMAIVDEADSILIDEARVPLILSATGAADAPPDFHAEAITLARPLLEGSDFRLDRVAMSVELLAVGRERIAAAARPLGAAWQHRLHREDTVRMALSALHLFQRDRHYIVVDGKVRIIDETTGRVASGRAWSRGLHQLIEIKEVLEPSQPTVTAAQITYQRFFARYLRLGGLSGTLRESRGELHAVYGLRVACVPLRLPSRRRQLPTRWFADHAALCSAVAARARALQQGGRAVLIGAESVGDAQALSTALQRAGVAHARLDARHDADEAQVVAAAGAAGAVTVATQMAGRGTDIPLSAAALERGGLHIISCQLNAARRIDRQLAGRCARQGEPGSVETWLSLDNALLRTHLPGPLLALLRPRAEALPSAVAQRLGGLAQRLQEQRDAGLRRRLLEQDRRLDRQLSFAGR